MIYWCTPFLFLPSLLPSFVNFFLRSRHSANIFFRFASRHNANNELGKQVYMHCWNHKHFLRTGGGPSCWSKLQCIQLCGLHRWLEVPEVCANTREGALARKKGKATTDTLVSVTRARTYSAGGSEGEGKKQQVGGKFKIFRQGLPPFLHQICTLVVCAHTPRRGYTG